MTGLSPISVVAAPSTDLTRFIGERDFTGRAGEVRYEYDHGNTTVEGDTDGDGSADLAVTLIGKIAMTGDDFLL
jgi:hypothetical protein